MDKNVKRCASEIAGELQERMYDLMKEMDVPSDKVDEIRNQVVEELVEARENRWQM